jgi:ABC-type multidrug transport system fused ATPase/permease subunit
MYAVVNLIGSIIILSYIWPISLLILVIVIIIVGLIIWKFDTVLILLQKQQNESSHKISSLLFDYLSNIKTLITLRFQDRAKQEVDLKMADLIPLSRKYAIYNEVKRFLMDTIIGALIVVMMMFYIKIQFARD